MDKKIYYVVENELGEEESTVVNTLKEARSELAKCKRYYKKECNSNPPYELFIVKHTEINEGDVIKEYTEEVK